MCGDALFFLWQSVFFTAQCNALNEERHIVSQCAHSLHTFIILLRLLGFSSVHAVPILARGDGHPADGEIFVELIKGRGATAAARNRNRSTNVVNVPFDGEIESLELVTQYLADGVKLAETADGFSVTLPASQGVMVKISVEAEEPAPELAITKQPESYEGTVGDKVVFTVEATGEGLTYEWFYKAVGSEGWLKSWSTGATTATLTVDMLAYRNGQAYRCIVTDATGETVVSDAAVMTLKAGEFSITEQPASYAGTEDDTVTFTVKAEGDNLSYRWQYSTDDGVTWQNSWSDGYATDTLTVKLLAYRDGQQYRCVVTNAVGDQLTSEAAVMSLKVSAIEITAQPQSVNVKAGQLVEFTVEATGENLKYRWYRSNDDGATWVETWLDGYNTNTLSFTANAARAATPYKCVITSGTNNVVSDPVTVTIG